MSDYINNNLSDDEMYTENQYDGSKLRAVRHGSKVHLFMLFETGNYGELTPVSYKTYVKKMDTFKTLKVAFWTTKKNQEHMLKIGMI